MRREVVGSGEAPPGGHRTPVQVEELVDRERLAQGEGAEHGERLALRSTAHFQVALGPRPRRARNS